MNAASLGSAARWTTRTAAAVLWLALLGGSPAGAETPPGPAVLVVCSERTCPALVDHEWLEELRSEGFEPDFLRDLDEFSWERIRRYHVLVLFSVPSPMREKVTLYRHRKLRAEHYVDLVERFLAAGGGVFFMAYTQNADQGLRELLDRWDARLPWEYFREDDPERVAPMPRMPSRYGLVRVDDVAPSPISAKVENLWWPYGDYYTQSFTGPIAVGDAWQVVVRGSSTSRTEPVTRANSARYYGPPPDPLVRPGGVERPALLAIRPYRAGRIVLLSQLPQFSIGQGTRWLYERRSLSRGARGVPSDWGVMIRNAFRWLAEPSRSAPGSLGGHRASASGLRAPGTSPGQRERFDPSLSKQTARRALREGRVFRGLLGAQSGFSAGRGDVAAWARAARGAGLDFLIFMEDFAGLTKRELRELDRLCREHSDSDLLLIPGYTIDNNVGNHLFFYGYDLPWPPDYVLRGDPPRLAIQAQDEKGRWVKGKKTHNWITKAHDLHRGHQIGVYRFDDPRAPRLQDMRDYSAVAVSTWTGGRRVDERLDDLLETALSTVPPIPLSVIELRDPDGLAREVRAGRPLIHAVAADLAGVLDEIDYSGRADAADVFVSDGPWIRAWPGMHRMLVFAEEPFLTDLELMRARLWITSEVGLEEVRVYDGDRVIRRFRPGGAKELDLTLHLPGVVQQNLIAVAYDVRGGRAVSAARRSRKEGETGIDFCTDRVNHCSPLPLLGHGPGLFALHQFPLLSRFEAGAVWDGGPRGVRPALEFLQNVDHPLLLSDAGEEGRRPFNNLPILETGNDQVVVVRSRLDRVYDPDVPVANAWRTWGPLEPARLLHSERRFLKYDRFVVGANPSAHRSVGLRTGALVAGFENRVTFLRPQRVKRLRLARSAASEVPVRFVRMGEDGPEVGDLSEAGRVKLPRGTWFGFFSAEDANAAWFLNRGEPLVLQTRSGRGGALRVELQGELRNTRVESGEQRRYALFSVNDPLETRLRGVERFARIVSYLDDPEGFELRRGRREPGDGGFLDLRADDGAVELRVPRPARPLEATLPLRVFGLEPRWSVGYLQVTGPSTGYLGEARDAYTSLSFDFEGIVHAAAFPDHAEWTHVWVGHPITSDVGELVLEVMPRVARDAEDRYDWHVAVHNPTDRPIEARLRQAMPVPGLRFEARRVTVAPGAHLVLRD